MNNKKAQESGLGLMGSHTIEAILAVAGICLLLLLAFMLFSFLRSQNLEKSQADATIDLLKADISGLENKESKVFGINSPQEWFVVFFEGNSLLPVSCTLTKDCICICEEADLKSCTESRTGSCMSTEYDVVLLKPVEIGIYTGLKLSLNENQLKIEELK